MIKVIVSSILEEYNKESEKHWYTKWITLALLLGLVGVGSWKAYNWYTVSQEKKAQVAFMFVLEDYNRLTNSQDDVNWQDAATTFAAVAKKYPKTMYGDLARMFEADCLSRVKGANSIEPLEVWVQTHTSKHPMYYLYKTRYALALANDASEHIRLLQELIADPKNIHKDMAQFFLGYYYWAQDDITQARTIWQQLIDSQVDVPAEGKSPWASIAESKLNYLP